MSRVLDILLAVASFLLSHATPKDRRLLVLGGRQLGGNTGPLLSRAAGFGFRAVWLTRRTEILALRRTDVVSTRSLRGMWLAARAGAVALTHSLGDFGPLVFARRTRLYNLWHGMPVKRISTADPGFATRRHARSNIREMRRYAAMFASSPAMADLFARTFGLERSRVIVTGQPRTDVLLGPAPVDPGTRYDPPLPPHEKRILYCPTWRDGLPVRLFPFADADMEAIQRFLEERDAVLFVRTHPNDPGRLERRDRRVVPMQGELVPEITCALAAFHVLVTDYSSVYFDYLLLDRPVIFLAYDLDEYAATPGFFMPFEDISAGPSPVTQADFLRALDEALDCPQSYAADRERVRRLVYEHADDRATERTLEFLRRDLLG
ncbi:MAG: CDP-glycerol glycerophosphotransferase family protein [Deltaproteobacteria bacterium]|nr:CDP-glycerol glycerophosphotransferase family protein [Deltaproteobacteria bacterium]